MKTIILQRLREPSTWAGVSVLLSMFGLPAGLGDAVGQTVAGAAAVAAILMREKSAP